MNDRTLRVIDLTDPSTREAITEAEDIQLPDRPGPLECGRASAARLGGLIAVSDGAIRAGESFMLSGIISRDSSRFGCYHRAMESTRQLTAIIEREGDAYVALCPELDIASQGQTVETARTSLIEALELFFESADPTEVARRLHTEVFVTRVEVAVG